LDTLTITKKGVSLALGTLIDGGYITPEETNSFRLADGCEKFLAASREKGDARTDEDKQLAILICVFLDQLQNVNRKVN
jgi:hypothetical protein